jgi:hypothetical protein
MCKWILLIVIVMSPFVSTSSLADADQGRVKALMHSFVLELSKMSPYLASEQAFASDPGRKAVTASLEALDRKIQNPPAELNSSTGFRITFGLLADHITKTKAIFDRGHLEYARVRLNGMTNLCAACHTQTPKISSHSPFAAFGNLSSPPTFENSNFLFVIRRYDDALTGFDRLIRGYPKSGLKADLIMEVYRRKLAIFARVKRDPVAAIANFKDDLRNQDLPIDAKQNVLGWIENLTKWLAESEDPSKFTTPELIAFVAKKIPPALDRRIAPSDPQLMNLLRLSGLLYERLYSEPDPKYTQELLYYLAMCERSLASINWYSLNEIYLKECVVRFPKQPMTKKCFEAYRTGMEEHYHGEAMPDFIRGSIDALKGYL